MNHLDEGTIHAWLDGAVGAAQAAEIEAHVAQCAVCSAAVAEARGFIAGASRILNALDDVPAGVTPKRAVPPPHAPAVRQWRASRWVTSIAAALMLAIGITTWNRGAVQKDMPTLQPGENAQTVAALADSPGTQTDSSVRAQTAEPPVAAPGVPDRVTTAPTAVGRVTAAPAARLRTTTATANRADGTRLRRTTTVPSREDALQRQSAEVASSAPAPAPSAAAPVAPEARRRLSLDSTLTLEHVVITGGSGGGASDPARAAGCYPLSAVSDTRRMSKAVGEVAGADAGAARTSAGARASARPLAPSAAASADFAATAPQMLRLDTLRRPPGYVVRSAASDSSVGWWSRWGTDSVRVNLPASGVFLLALKDRGVCPER